MSSKQLVVLGMHRSGTSMLTHLLHAMGCYAGPPEELVPANAHNPGGFWERIDANTIDSELLRLCGATWCHIATFSPSRVAPEDRERMTTRIQSVIADLSAHPVSVIKEPRMCLLFDFWRGHFPAPVCIFILRRPTEVAASLKRRDGYPSQVGIALWEAYTRAALRSAEGLPSCLVWYDELMVRPHETLAALRDSLSEAGVDGLRVPDEDELNTLIRPDLRSRSGLASDAREFLNDSQLTLYQYLQEGDLTGPAPGELSLGARETLRCFQDDWIRRTSERRNSAERECQLRNTHDEQIAYLRDASDVLFDSLRWRAGHGIFSVLDRLLGRGDSPQPADAIRDTLNATDDALPPLDDAESYASIPFDGGHEKRIVAIMFTYNEERFLEDTIQHLVSHGVDIYLSDNGSTDATLDIAHAYRGNGVMRIDHVPRGPYYDLRANLSRTEELSGIVGADWIIRADADERHLPPGGGTLSRAFAQLEEQGFNAVNFMECVFIPTCEQPDHDHSRYESTMTWFYPYEPRHPHQLTAWRQPSSPIEIAWSGGHLVRFPGLNMCPRPFLMKHYPYLSVDHAAEKYLPRNFHPAAVRQGWHGWRATMRREDIDLPSQSELRPWPERGHPDISDPWKVHWLGRNVAQGLAQNTTPSTDHE